MVVNSKFELDNDICPRYAHRYHAHNWVFSWTIHILGPKNKSGSISEEGYLKVCSKKNFEIDFSATADPILVIQTLYNKHYIPI